MHPNDKTARRKKRRATRSSTSKTHPDNWPLQEVHTLEDLIADRSVTMNIKKEILHASYR